MSLVAKLTCIFCFFFGAGSVGAKDIYILVVGQSISSNCNEHIYGPSRGVYQIDLEGNRIPASDPFLWAACKKGSMWIPLGEKIISSGMADTVTFMPIGTSGSSVKDWLPHGKDFEKLEKVIKLASDKSIYFNYAFWHQGSSDSGRDSEVYVKELKRVIRYLSANLKVDKWIISQHSRCGNVFDKNISQAQYNFSLSYLFRYFPGPDTNGLGNEFRFDSCHLNRRGQEKMADLWLESMMSAERVDSKVQRETLLYYFRTLF